MNKDYKAKLLEKAGIYLLLEADSARYYSCPMGSTWKRHGYLGIKI